MTENSPPQNLLRTNIVVGFGTFLSRITGFLRVLLLASVFGFTGLSDVYNTANTTPNIIYELLLGGILSATLLPVFVRQFADGDSEGMSAVLSVVALALGVLTLVATLCAPYIIGLYAVSRGADYTVFLSVGTRLAYCFLPQIFFYGVIALATSMLNARHRFAVPAYAPILNNLIVMAVLGAIVFLFQGTRDLAYAAEHPA
ncbi:MAG: lipid II flippase MurJ, partial [Pseudomonadota bacterium]